MATSILTSPLFLPALTTLIGTGGLTVGVYSFLNPIAAARIYGIPVSTTSPTAKNRIPDLTSFLVPSDSKSKTNTNTSKSQPQPDTALLHSLAIRNLTFGLLILALTAYYYKFILIISKNDPDKLTVNLSSVPANDPMVYAVATRDALRIVLGITISIGGFVPFVDARVCWGAYGDGYGDGEVGRRAGWVHCLRGWCWVLVGFWCSIGW